MLMKQYLMQRAFSQEMLSNVILLLSLMSSTRGEDDFLTFVNESASARALPECSSDALLTCKKVSLNQSRETQANANKVRGRVQ